MTTGLNLEAVKYYLVLYRLPRKRFAWCGPFGAVSSARTQQKGLFPHICVDVRMNKGGEQAKAGGLWATEVQELTHKVPPTPPHIQAVVSPALPASGLQPLRWPGTWDPGINQSLSLENLGTCEIVSVTCFLPTASMGFLQPACEEYRSPASFSSSTRWRHSSGYGWVAHWLNRRNSFKIHQLCSALCCLLCFSEDIFFFFSK